MKLFLKLIAVLIFGVAVYFGWFFLELALAFRRMG